MSYEKDCICDMCETRNRRREEERKQRVASASARASAERVNDHQVAIDGFLNQKAKQLEAEAHEQQSRYDEVLRENNRLLAENTRLAKEHQQVHDYNSTIVTENQDLKKRLELALHQRDSFKQAINYYQQTLRLYEASDSLVIKNEAKVEEQKIVIAAQLERIEQLKGSLLAADERFKDVKQQLEAEKNRIPVMLFPTLCKVDNLGFKVWELREAIHETRNTLKSIIYSAEYQGTISWRDLNDIRVRLKDVLSRTT